MKHLVLLGCVLLVAPALPAAAGPPRGRQERPPQEEQADAVEVVELRVLSVDAERRVTIDRGTRDGLAVDDALLFFPRSGGSRRGSVVQLEGRSAVVEIDGPTRGIEPGVRGEVRIPAARLAPVEPPVEEVDEGVAEGEADPEQPVELERPPWENRDEEWAPGMPLLSRVRSVRPEERATRLTGRGWLRLDNTWTTEGDREDHQWRVGSNLRVENPFGYGGVVHLDAEYDDRSTTVPDDDDVDDTIVRFERLSYAWGGDRFAPDRWEIGRFLQRTVPEFGVVDGFQYERRAANGDRYGASLGYLPELNADFETGDDLAVSAWYQWTADEEERFTVTGGFQKTWNDGDPDRDLLVAKVRYLPVEGWDLHGSTWIDFYGGGDDAKDSSVEVTHAILAATRDFGDERALDVTYRRVRFPELLRDELAPVALDQLADDRYDRLSAGGWTVMRGDRRLHGEVGLWDDEDEAGADLELGLEFPDFLVDGSRTDVTVFAAKGRFSTSGGARADWSLGDPHGRWDVLYELSGHRQDGFSSAIDDFLQHRLRGSRSVFSAGGWSVYFDLEALVYDDEGAVSIGLHLEESF